MLINIMQTNKQMRLHDHLNFRNIRLNKVVLDSYHRISYSLYYDYLNLSFQDKDRAHAISQTYFAIE